MAKYRKKPVVIEAFKSGIDKQPNWFIEAIHNGVVTFPESKGYKDSVYCFVNTLEGTMTASLGDYIVKGIDGELYPCKYDIFERTYELVE